MYLSLTAQSGLENRYSRKPVFIASQSMLFILKGAYLDARLLNLISQSRNAGTQKTQVHLV